MIGLFLSYLRLERNRSELTVLRYERSLRDFENYFERKDEGLTWSTVDADVIREWVETRVDAGNKATTICADLAAVRSFFRFALARKLVQLDPAHCITGPRRQKPLPQFVKEREMNSLLDEESWGKDYKNVRARTILIMLYEAGLRRSELTALDDKDVDFTTRQIRVTGKRRKQRVIPFGDELEEALRTYMAAREEQFGNTGEALFLDNKGRRMTGGQVYTEVKKHLTGATNLSKRSPHVLRHSFATALLNHGAGLENVRQLLGHESVKTTEIYTHATFEQMKRVYKDAHPRG
jgi:integrase/recombinase XerC